MKARTYKDYTAALRALVALGFPALPVLVAECTKDEAHDTGVYPYLYAQCYPEHGETVTYYEVSQGDAVLGYIAQVWFADGTPGVASAMKML